MDKLSTDRLAVMILGSLLACVQPVADARPRRSCQDLALGVSRSHCSVNTELAQVSLEGEVLSPDARVAVKIEQAQPTPCYPNPSFVADSLYSIGRSQVLAVAEAEMADVVLLKNGQDRGYRMGMICEVLNAEDKVGEIILVDVRSHSAAGLITKLETNRIIHPDDTVKIKLSR